MRRVIWAAVVSAPVRHGFAVEKGDSELRGKLNDGLSQVVEDGTWLKLHRQFPPTAPGPAGFGS